MIWKSHPDKTSRCCVHVQLSHPHNSLIHLSTKYVVRHQQVIKKFLVFCSGRKKHHVGNSQHTNSSANQRLQKNIPRHEPVTPLWQHPLWCYHMIRLLPHDSHDPRRRILSHRVGRLFMRRRKILPYQSTSVVHASLYQWRRTHHQCCTQSHHCIRRRSWTCGALLPGSILFQVACHPWWSWLSTITDRHPNWQCMLWRFYQQFCVTVPLRRHGHALLLDERPNQTTPFPCPMEARHFQPSAILHQTLCSGSFSNIALHLPAGQCTNFVSVEGELILTKHSYVSQYVPVTNSQRVCTPNI
jgi:hypothetical protein